MAIQSQSIQKIMSSMKVMFSSEFYFLIISELMAKWIYFNSSTRCQNDQNQILRMKQRVSYYFSKSELWNGSVSSYQATDHIVGLTSLNF